MNEDEFLNFLRDVGSQSPPEQIGTTLLALIGMRLQDVDVRKPKSGLVVAHPTA